MQRVALLVLRREPETSTPDALVFLRECRKSVVPAKSLIHSDRRCADEITRSADSLMNLGRQSAREILVCARRDLKALYQVCASRGMLVSKEIREIEIRSFHCHLIC